MAGCEYSLSLVTVHEDGVDVVTPWSTDAKRCEDWSMVVSWDDVIVPIFRPVDGQESDTAQAGTLCRLKFVQQSKLFPQEGATSLRISGRAP